MKITTFNKLKKYENYLYTAKYANYIRSLSNTQVEDLIVAGNEIDIQFKNNHCGICILNFIKKLAEKYFEQKEKNEKNDSTKKKDNNKKSKKNDGNEN